MTDGSPEAPTGAEYTYVDKLIITLGNKEQHVFDKCRWTMHPNAMIEIGVRETRRENNTNITQFGIYNYKLADVLTIKQIYIESVTSIEPSNDNVLEFKKDV